MIDCSFELNGKPISALKCGTVSFPAFSGYDKNANQPQSACQSGIGPIPPGAYYILDRQSGGLLGYLRDMFSDRKEWFALYAIDKEIDDITYCNEVKRGNFRLHPKGPLGISQGCITVESLDDFKRLRSILKESEQTSIPGTNLKAYGKVTVVVPNSK